MATSFTTHKFTYILPGIIYHPDVDNPVDHERSGIDTLACPCIEPRMITAILANLWTLDCQITKNVYFSLRSSPYQCERCALLSAIPKIT